MATPKKGAKKSSFAASMRKNYEGQWKKHRTATSGRSDNELVFERLSLHKGDFMRVEARVVTANCGEDKNNKPYFSIDFVITEGPGSGLTLGSFYSIADRGGMTATRMMDILSANLKDLGYGDVNDEDEDYVEEVATLLGKDKPLVSLNVGRTERDFLNVYINKRIDEEEQEIEAEPVAVAASQQEAPVAEPEEAEEEVEEEVEGEEEEEEELVDIEIDDVVFYRAPRAKATAQCQVVAINEEKQTVDLSRLSDSKAYKGVSLNEVEVVFEDE